MAIKEFINKSSLVTCTPDASVREVAQLMKDHDVGAVLICEKDKPVGIVTDRDLAIRCLSENHNHAKCTAEDHMSEKVASVPLDAGIHDIVSLMREEEVRRVVVTDNKGKVSGIVSQGDILKLLARELNDLAAGTSPEEEKLTGESKSA